MKFTAALPKHAQQAAPLMRLSGPKAFDYVFSSKQGISSTAYLEKYFATPHTIFSHKYHYVLLNNDEVVGTLALTTKQNHDDGFFQTAKSMISHYGLRSIMRGLLFELRLVRPPKKQHLCVGHVAIKPSYRGKGLGGQLIQQADLIARHRGFKTLALDVRADNLNAIELYKRNDYKAKKYSKSFTQKLDDHIYMEKRLE